jgi:tRNA-(MS[2]IO[6]A)-hydroxylase (MiaE)
MVNSQWSIVNSQWSIVNGQWLLDPHSCTLAHITITIKVLGYLFNTVLPTINALKQPTSDAWIEQAIANLDIILLDHSHCERKAAGVALNFMFRYPSNTKMVRELTAIARED